MSRLEEPADVRPVALRKAVGCLCLRVFPSLRRRSRLDRSAAGSRSLRGDDLCAKARIDQQGLSPLQADRGGRLAPEIVIGVGPMGTYERCVGAPAMVGVALAGLTLHLTAWRKFDVGHG